MKVHLSIIAAMLLAASTACVSCSGSKRSESTPQTKAEPAQPTLSLSHREGSTEWANGRVNQMTAKMFGERIVEYNSGQTVFNCPIPSVIDFNATWCGPCHQIAPILSQLAKQYKGRVAFYSIDVDDEPELARSLGVQSIPYLVFANNGNYSTHIGFAEEELLKTYIEETLKMGDKN